MKKFKETYQKDERVSIFNASKKKNKDCIMVIIEKDEKSIGLPELKNPMFGIAANQRVQDICNAIRKRIVNIDRKYESQSIFISTSKIIPRREILIKDLYQNEKDPEDNLLYLKYGAMEPY